MSAVEWTEEEMLRMGAKALGRPVLAQGFQPEISADAEAERIARRYRLSVADLKGPCREKRIARARFELYASLHARGWSSPEIGRFVGGRDHTTVLTALRKMGIKSDRRTGAPTQSLHTALRAAPREP